MISPMTAEELKSAMNDGHSPAVIDVREGIEYTSDHIEGAEHIPLEELSKEITARHPDKDEEVVVYCEYGIRSHHAARLLRSLGYNNVREMQGGLLAFRQQYAQGGPRGNS